MLKKTLILAGALVVTSLSASVFAQSDPNATQGAESTPAALPANGAYAEVNGINLYYETYGTGEPLILLHGGLGAIEMFGPLLPALAETRQVIAVDLQGHGRTADIDRPMSYQTMADDVAALIHYLKIDKADVMGYSLGGGVALQTAIRHPELVRKLVLLSTPFKRDGWYPEVLQGMAMMSAENANMMVQTPMYQLYAAVAPKPEQWASTVGKLGTLLGTDYDWSSDIPNLKMPVLLVVGDADSEKLSHAVDFFGLLGGGKVDGASKGRPISQLAVLTDTTHFTIFADAVRVTPVVVPFLDAK